MNDTYVAVQWATAPYFNTTEYKENPFCEDSTTYLQAPSTNSELNDPARVSDILVAMRCIGIILPSLFLVLFSWTGLYKDVLKRNIIMYTLSFIVAGYVVTEQLFFHISFFPSFLLFSHRFLSLIFSLSLSLSLSLSSSRSSSPCISLSLSLYLSLFP